eukprot:10713924-Heterocapsa_arctica.AAC.1
MRPLALLQDLCEQALGVTIRFAMTVCGSHVCRVRLEGLFAPKRACGFGGVPGSPTCATRYLAYRWETVGELVHEYRCSWIADSRQNDQGRRRDGSLAIG